MLENARNSKDTKSILSLSLPLLFPFTGGWIIDNFLIIYYSCNSETPAATRGQNWQLIYPNTAVIYVYFFIELAEIYFVEPQSFIFSFFLYFKVY